MNPTLPGGVYRLSAAEIIGMIRDIVLISILLVTLLLLVVLYSKLSSVMDSIRRTMKSAEEVTGALSAKIVGPAAAGSGVAFGAGKVAAFILGLSKKRKRRGGNEDGGQ
jgi:hypothetical protein